MDIMSLVAVSLPILAPFAKDVLKDIVKDIVKDSALKPLKNGMGRLIGEIEKKFTDKNEQRRVLLHTTVLLSYTECLEKALQLRSKDSIPFEYDEKRIADIWGEHTEEFRIEEFDIEKPFHSPFIKNLHALYEKLLVELQFSADSINAILKEVRWNFPIHFFSQLETEDAQKFDPLMEYLKSKAYKAQQKKYKHKQYEHDLAALYTGKTFLNEENAPTLDKIYVEPHISLYNAVLNEEFWKDYRYKMSKSLTDEYYPLKNEDIHTFTKKFLTNGLRDFDNIETTSQTRRERFFLVLGAPGQGKSSFCKRLLYDILRSNDYGTRQVYFVRMGED